MPLPNSLDPQILEAALTGLLEKLRVIDEQIATVRSLIGARRRGRPPNTEAVAAGAVKQSRKKRVMSAEARKRIGEAQKKRWAAFHKKQS